MGYSRAVVKGDWCFVSGVTGYDFATMVMPEDVVEQAHNTVATIDRVLQEAGFALTDVVRATYILTDIADLDAVRPVLRASIGEVRPAATLLVAGLARPEMKIEIEVTAFRE